MALTKKDIQTIKEVVKETVNDSEQRVMSKTQSSIDVLKIYMDTKFKETREDIKNTRNEILQEIDAVLQNHEDRIVRLERRTFSTS